MKTIQHQIICHCGTESGSADPQFLNAGGYRVKRGMTFIVAARILCLLLLFGNIFSATAIDVISLNNAMPNSEVRITATQEITLLPGFTANAANGGTFHAQIGTVAEVFPLSLLPQAEPSHNRNYIHTRTYQTANGLQYFDRIQYYDGLGRPDELVLRGVTPTGKNLVSLTEYDAFGRAHKQWLPVPVASNSGAYVNPATLKNTAQSHYSDSRPFAETVFENSPLNRIEAQRGAGAAWGINNSVRTVYWFNNDEVPNFTVNTAGQIVRDGNYRDLNLYRTITTDEDNKTTAEYKDKLGRVIMTQSSTNVKTVYVYNNLGQLAFVLPPLAVDGLSANATIPDSHTVLRQYAYLYKYDERGNMIEKRLPGCEPVYMVYDRANRLVLSQDGNQRTQQRWIVIKYDPLGRVTYTGIITDSRTRAQLKTFLDLRVITEQFVGASGFNNTGYTYSHFANAITPLSVNYYDNYAFLDLNQQQKPQLSYAAKDGFGTQHHNAKGLLTGTRSYLLDNSGNYLTTAMYYDHKGQAVQNRASNYLSGYDITYNNYDFVGNLLKTRHEHNSTNGSATYEYTYGYDHAGRLKTTQYQLGNNPVIMLSANTYDELGRLVQKKRHNGTDTELAEYNIRNQPTKLKSGAFEQNLYYNTNLPTGATAVFNGNIAASTWTYNGTTRGYNYFYDALNRLQWADFKKGSSSLGDGYANEEFYYDKHGNIKNLYRRINDGGHMVDYLNYSYDGNRLMSILDHAGSQSLYGLKEYHNYNTSGNDFAYDANGNMIKDLDRKIVTIKYNLLNLPDAVQFSDGNQIANLYSADGRKLRTDSYTMMTTLNAPITEGEVLQPNTTMMRYTGTIYIGDMEYVTSGTTYMSNTTNAPSLSRIYNPEGYNNGQWHYYRRDHLGNNREVWNAGTGATVQRTQYYSSGLPWASNTGDNPSRQPYKHQGKEFIEMHGYDMFDFHARGYHPATMRFTTPDPMAEIYYSVSPYAYVLNNPIKYIDPDGRVVRLANNYAGGMENIAKIAATSYGSRVMSHLISSRETYTMNSTFWSSSSSYNPRNGNINYVGNPWYSQIPYDGGALNSMTAMGHETFHAYDHSTGIFNSSNYRSEITEPRAVSFANYLRQSYSLSPLRDGYGNIQGNFHQFPSNEKISDFTTLGHNADKTSYGFSYTKTTTIVESYRSFGGLLNVPDKIRTETSNHFITVSRNRKNEVSFQIFDNEDAYRNATSNW